MSGNKAKILIYDLEVTPIRGYAFGIWNTNLIKMEQDSNLMCFSYKWLGEKKVHSVSQLDYPARWRADRHDDYDVVKRLHELRNEADITVAHNNDRFDKRVANARFLIHDLGPPSPSRSVDTLKVARRHFKLPSNSLDNVAKALGMEGKTQEKYADLWYPCLQDDRKAWRKMIKYCDQDVRVLEQVYLKLRPWITNHPNLAMYGDRPDVCPKCGSPKLINKGTREANTLVYQRYKCNDCGGWGQAVRADKDFEKPEFKNISET